MKLLQFYMQVKIFLCNIINSIELIRSQISEDSGQLEKINELLNTQVL